MNYNVFGSEDSQDYDIMIFIDEIPSIQASKEMCLEMDSELQLMYRDKKINTNLAVIKDGIIVDVFKGTSDECNNSIFKTYHLHNQLCPLLINREVPRNVNLKLARSLRAILSFLSRTSFSNEVKKALKGNAVDKINTLENICFSSLTDLNKNNQDIIDFRKQVAFQMGQCRLLMNRIEVYTKSGICIHYPCLSSYLYREISNGDDLEAFKQIFLSEVKNLDVENIKE
jgi:hypothetical protein